MVVNDHLPGPSSPHLLLYRMTLIIAAEPRPSYKPLGDGEFRLLHYNTAPTAGLWCVGVLAFRHDTPHGGNHVISGAIAVCDDAAMEYHCQLAA